MADDIIARLKELRNLPHEERIKRLKELEEQNKKEIEQAHKLLAESEAEVEQSQKEKEDLPLPQLSAADIDTLISEEERRIFSTKRFIAPNRKDDDEDKDAKPGKELSLDNLEDALSQAPKVRLNQAQLQEH